MTTDNLLIYTNNIKNNMSNIDITWKSIMEYLYKAEGSYLHYNKGESDITTAGGVYRHAHNDAAVFEYIDNVATSIGITTPSSMWDSETLIKVNDSCNEDVLYYLVYKFYKIYFKGAHLEMFTTVTATTIVSLYTNTTKGCWIAVQGAITDMVSHNLLNNITVSSIDGFYGDKTKSNLADIKHMNKTTNILFKIAILNRMKSYYIDLATKNPDKYLKYLKGWDNRVNNIL